MNSLSYYIDLIWNSQGMNKKSYDHLLLLKSAKEDSKNYRIVRPPLVPHL